MSDGDPESMTRAELESEVSDLRERVREAETDIAFLKNTLTTLTDADLGDTMGITELPDHAEELRGEVEDLQTATSTHARKIEQLDDAPGASAGVAKVAKVREAIVRRATRRGKTTVAQAAQQKPVAMDYEEVLALFDYGIDRSYASNLISRAACDESDDHEAFWEDKTGNKKKLKIDLSELPAESPYRPRSSDVTTEKRDDRSRESSTTSYSEGGG